MTDLIAGIISLAIALGFLSVLVYKVAAVPLWLVILAGAATMVVSFVASVRSNQNV